MTFNATFQWVLAACSITMLWLMGNGSKWGPRVGLMSQILWAWYTIHTAQWGLLACTAAFVFVHVRNSWRMRAKQT